MKAHIKTILIFLFLAGLLSGCQENPLPVPERNGELNPNEAPVLTQKINKFVELFMDDIYLWNNEMPDIDIRYEFDSKEYFDKLLYKDDKWSFITDDVEALENSFEGVETSFGYSLSFARFSNTGDVFALVEYVYPNTPASEAGLQRGDIIVQMNHSDITDKNYTDLLYANNLSITLGTINEDGISIQGAPVPMTARQLVLDPVLIYDVIENNGHKIGYLFYAQYIGEFNSSLNEAFQYFQNEQITDLVVDLRYNPGGGIEAAQYFCSSVAPLSTVNSSSTLVTFQWNEKYQNLWQSLNARNQLRVTFLPLAQPKLGLNKMHILTGKGTASASELTITGLKPYMNIVTVGDSTFGKYTGSQTFKPEDLLKDKNGNGYYVNESEYRNFENWGIQPIILRYANSLGVTDFKDGFAPDIAIKDDIFAGYPLGDINEPLLKAAVEDITGNKIIAMKKSQIKHPPFTIFDRGFSKFDANKREVLVEKAGSEMLINTQDQF